MWAGAAHFLPSMTDDATSHTFNDALREIDDVTKKDHVDLEEEVDSEEDDSDDDVYYETVQSFEEYEVDSEEEGEDRSEEHTSELQSLMRNSYAVFSLKK